MCMLLIPGCSNAANGAGVAIPLLPIASDRRSRDEPVVNPPCNAFGNQIQRVCFFRTDFNFKHARLIFDEPPRCVLAHPIAFSKFFECKMWFIERINHRQRLPQRMRPSFARCAPGRGYSPFARLGHFAQKQNARGVASIAQVSLTRPYKTCRTPFLMVL